MAILMSMYNVWCEKILNGTKPLEFRNNIGKDFKIGDKIYLYESSRYGGRKKVVGEVTIKNIVALQKSRFGFLNFLDYFVKNILKDEELYKIVKETYEYDLPNYDAGYKFTWMFAKDVLDNFKSSNKLPNYLQMSREEVKRIDVAKKKSEELIEQCDTWLHSIGYYNECGESFYKNYIEISDPIIYKTPLNLSDFENLKGETINRAPQSWCYVKTR